MSEVTLDRPFILDMDGVLYRGERPAPGLTDFFGLLPVDGFVCVTNNSLLGVDELVDKLARMGVDITPDRFVPVSEAVRDHLETTARPGTPTLVIGGPVLRRAVRASGMESADGGPVEIVVVGLDLDVRFDQLATAVTALRSGARMIATSEDPVLLTEDGVVPGTGAFVALLRTCADVEVELVGKPHRPLFRLALEVLGCNGDEVVVVGDSVRADIAGGKDIGATTVLVGSGVTTVDSGVDHGADHAVRDLNELLDHLRGGP